MKEPRSPNTDSANGRTGASASSRPAGKTSLVMQRYASSRASAAPAATPGGHEPSRSHADWLNDPLMAAAHGVSQSGAAVQQKGDGGAEDPQAVQRAASTGVAGAGGELPHRAAMEQGYGVSLGDVRAHTGREASAANQAMGAEAYTTGSDIAFRGGNPAPSLVAHEVAHVIQQKAGVAPSGGVGQAGDSFEREADAAADVVARGGTADLAQRYGVSSGTTAVQAKAVQRFGSGEHMQIGDTATQGEHGETRTVQLADDYRVTYGEMVAMAGDYFASIEQMRQLARTTRGAGSREEIEYVRVVKIHGHEERAGEFDDAVIAAVDERYFSLAGQNTDHFLNPRTGDENRSVQDRASDTVTRYRIEWDGAVGARVPYEAPAGAGAAYRQHHMQAMFEAYVAGIDGSGVDAAMATEAFGNHYLTDSFAGGHVRTARISISEHWNPRVPMFFYNLKGMVAERLAEQLETEILGGLPTEDLVYHQALPKVDAAMADKGELTFGDLVAGAVHDYDNQNGVQVTIDGNNATLHGDGHLGEGDELDASVRAVQASVADIERVYELGAGGATILDVLDATVTDGLFAAERLLPRPIDDASLPEDERRIRWDFPDADTLLGDARFQEALTLFTTEKAGEFEAAAAALDDEDSQRAFREQVVEPLRSNPVQMVMDVVHWTPDTGGGVGGHNQDDNAMDYFRAARDIEGGLASLTYTQRENLMQDLIDGATVGDEEDALMDILRTASDSDTRSLIDHFGWEELYDEIDDGPGEDFAETYPEDEYD